MNKFKKIINYTILNLLAGFILFFIKKDKHIAILGLSVQATFKSEKKTENFLHNTKYLFLHSQKNTCDLKFIYLCDNKEMHTIFKERGLKNIYYRKSLKGLYYILKAKYWLYNYGPSDVANPIFSRNAVRINMWHGSGALKKVGYDACEQLHNFKPNHWKHKIYSFFKFEDNYIIVNSLPEANCHKTAFALDNKQIKLLGTPRLDVLYHHFDNENIFIENDFNYLKNLKSANKKIIFYMPTFRDTGYNVYDWLNSEELEILLKENNSILVCKFHPSDYTEFDITKSHLYKLENRSDIYPMMQFSDCLITDYSSISFDYLLVDKPLIYYVPDLEKYQEQCRGFYSPYDEIIAGEKVTNDSELFNAINNVLHGVDNHKERRTGLRNKFFKYQDGKNCERVIDWIKSLG